MLGSIQTNHIQLHYETYGHPENEAILLIAGLASQMIHWNNTFCEMLAKEGFYVIRYDQRDVGLSSHFTDHLTIEFSDLIRAITTGADLNLAYTLDDMAADAIALLDALSIDQAHIIGRSMGGMIAQLIASKYSQRVLSLTAIMSSTGNPHLPSAKTEVMHKLTQAAPDPKIDLSAYVEHKLEFSRYIASPGYPFDEDTARTLILEEYHRAYNPTGLKRQLMALAVCGDIRKHIASITVPTLVIHGTDDQLIPVECGKDIALCITTSTLLLIDGMGHDLPAALYPKIIAAIIQNQSSLHSTR